MNRLAYNFFMKDTSGIRHYDYIYGDNGVLALQIATETSNTNSMQISTYEIERARGWQCRQAMRTRWCGGISADLTFLLLFWSSKKVEEENMNGRLYDPVIARFFSPDKYVANSSFTQNWDWGKFVLNVELGAFSGAATWGIGTVFGPVGSAGITGEVEWIM